MNTELVHDGTQNAVVLHGTAEVLSDSPRDLRSLMDLLDLLQKQGTSSNFAMLETTASQFSKFTGKTLDEINIEELDDSRDDFRRYLEEHKYKKNTVRSYSNYARILYTLAIEAGWVRSSPLLSEEWQYVLGHAPQTKNREPRCSALIRYLAKQGLSPREVTEDDLSIWINGYVRGGNSLDYARFQSNLLRKLLVRAGMNRRLEPKRIRRDPYGVPPEQLPSSFRSELTDLISWKTAMFRPGRSKRAKVRLVTAKQLERTIRSIYGFGRNILHLGEFSTLAELLREDLVSEFAAWTINERHVKGSSIKTKLTLIHGALHQHPKYKSLNLRWLEELIKGMPEDDPSAIGDRQAEKYLSYEVLERIPDKIRSQRRMVSQDGPVKLALQVRDELLTKWLVVLAWRQRNIRECRIKGEQPNLFKAPIPLHSKVSKAKWVIEEEKRNPKAEFWQCKFSPEETKTKHTVHFVLPQSLICLLEEYLKDHREHLVVKPDPGTLFLKTNGTSFKISQFSDLVSELTLRYGGKAVHPHLYRNIIAYTWLEHHPEDYLTLSKLLWHRDVSVTLKIYGRLFDESNGVSRMDEWLQARNI